MQSSYGINQAAALLGMLADSSFKHTDSMIAEEALVPSRAVMRVPNTADRVQGTKATYATLTVTADLITGNSTIITVGGQATTATVYGTSHAATMAAIVAKVAALSTVAKAILNGSNNRVIEIWTTGAVNDASGETTLGASQPTWGLAASLKAADFYGVCQLSSRLAGTASPNSDNSAQYPAESLVNILRKGRIWVNFETAFDPDKDDLYVRHTADTGKYVGDFRNTSDSSKATILSSLPIRVITHLTAAGMGVIELNLP